MTARRSLITGGGGFIGSHMAEELLNRGGEVYVIDDLSTGSMENIDHLLKHPRFHYLIDTIANESRLAEWIDRCDTVYHLAAAVGVRLVVESPVRTIETNVHGTELVLRHADKKKKRVLLTSTSEVYGKANSVPFREDQDLVLGPTFNARWSYACSKALDEFLALAYWRERRLPVVIARLFNTVGPRQTGRYGMVVPTFVRQSLRGEPITIYGDGRQSRCFTFVGDVVNALIQLAEADGVEGEIFNVGSSEEITIDELAQLVKEVSGSSSDIVHIPYEKAYQQGFEDMRRRVPDLAKIHSWIGYAPTVDIRGVLERVLTYERQRGVELAQPPSGNVIGRRASSPARGEA